MRQHGCTASSPTDDQPNLCDMDAIRPSLSAIREVERIRDEVLSSSPPNIVCPSTVCPYNSSPDNWVWNRIACGDKVVLLDDTTAVFHPLYSNSSQALAGTRELSNGIYYWEIVFAQRVFGTAMMVGVGSAKTRMESRGFDALIGEDSNSWGLSHKGYLHHGGVRKRYCDEFAEHVPTVIGVLVDGPKGELTFFKDGVHLGVAFHGINAAGVGLYPMVSSTAAKTIMQVRNMQKCDPSLQDLCRDVILSRVREPADVLTFKLPSHLKRFVILHSWKIPNIRTP